MPEHLRVNTISYLPVSAIPTTSFPSRAGGHAHAWIGVGSLNPAKASFSFSGISNCPKDTMGTTVELLWIVMECFCRNALASSGEGADVEEDGGTGAASAMLASASAFLLLFSFLLFLCDDDARGVASFADVETSAGVGTCEDSSDEAAFRFFFFSECSVATSSGAESCSRLRFFFFFSSLEKDGPAAFERPEHTGISS